VTREDAIERLAEADEDEDLEGEAAELFAALYEREADPDDGDAGELISHCYADPDVAMAVVTHDATVAAQVEHDREEVL
jgi:hypothetical protein